MTFSARLKKMRIEKNVTQKAIADFLQMTPNAYQKYEYGEREPSLETLVKLSSHFNVPSDYLLGTNTFSNWEDIEDNWDAILDNFSIFGEPIQSFITGLVDSCHGDKIKIWQILSSFIKSIDFDHENNTITVILKND